MQGIIQGLRNQKMGREFHEQCDDHDEELDESYHPGCMGGIFNALDYHHWYNVKKMFPHRKYNRGRRHARCCANPQTISMEREPVETEGLLDSEEGHIQVQEQTRKAGSTKKSSGKASMKGLSGKEKLKEDNNKHWILGFPEKPQLQQPDSTHHHLETSGYGLGWMNPIILVRKKAETSDSSATSSLPETLRKQVTRSKKPDIHGKVNADNHLEHKKLDKKKGTRTLINQKPMSKEGVDVLDIFKVNNDLFLDILQDPEVGISQPFPGKKASKTLKLTKSGSFPAPYSPRTRYLRSRTLEHKQSEVWFIRNGEKSLDATELSKSRGLRTDGSFRSIITEEASSSSQGSDSQSWNHLVMNRLKDIKQRIKQALKERRKNISRAMERREMSQSLKKTAMEQDSIDNFNSSLQTNASDHSTNNGRFNRIRRTKSINESLDRYTKLFDHSISKEADLNHSKSLKLRNEDKVPSSGRAPKFFRRISSLSDLESFCSLLHEVSRDAFSSEIPIRSILNYEANKESDSHIEPKSISYPEDMDKFELVETVIEAELQEKMTEANNHSSTDLLVDRNGEDTSKTCDFEEDKFQLAMEKSSPSLEQKSVFTVNPSRELTQPTSELSDITSMAEHPISEGIGLNRPNLPEGEAESYTFLKERRTSNKSVEYETMGISSRFLFFESDNEADPCYNYVRDILELSGFIQNEYHQTWYSLNQPLNPSLFKELETLLHPDQLECSIDEVGNSCDHQLVFDLVNEALLEISERSSIYFPRPFSFNYQISSMLMGNNVLQDVWKKVSSNLAFEPEYDQSLDDIIGRDLAKDAWNWMNLQAESEFMKLELEDLIFDELLDEVLCL